MRLTKTMFVLLAIFTAYSFGQKNFYVLPTSENIAIYANDVRQMNEKALESVGKTDKLKVIETSGKNYKVQSPSGKTGWVEKRLVSKTDAKVETFEGVEVTGYLDNPTPLVITDMDQGYSAPIDINRSFKDALKNNADKEMITRTR